MYTAVCVYVVLKMKTIKMNFTKPKTQQYMPIWDVLLNKTLNIMEICTPKGYIHSSCVSLKKRKK